VLENLKRLVVFGALSCVGEPEEVGRIRSAIDFRSAIKFHRE
jgi:hypothetical protein